MLNIGLIGCGIWGRAILRELLDIGVSVKIFEPYPSPLLDLRTGVVLVKNIHDLQQTDGVIIASPSTTHLEVLEQVLPWQLPTYVEKPLTTSLADARQLQTLDTTYIYMMHIWRYHGGIQLLGQLARNGTLGSITALRSTRANWTSPRTDANSVWNLAPHDLTIALEILGYIPAPKATVIEWHQGIARGMTALLGESPFVQIEVSNRSPDKRREVRLFGTAGMAILADEKVDYIDLYLGNDLTTTPTHQRLSFDATPPLRREVGAFIHFLKGGPPPISDFNEGLQTVEILAQLEELARTERMKVQTE